MYLTKYGQKEWLGSGIIAAVMVIALLCFALYFNSTTCYVLAFLAVLIWMGVAAFFRDPERTFPEDPSLLLSSADGVVRDIEVLKNCEANQVMQCDEVVRVGIFLSVFNVHLNRAPCDLIVDGVVYKEGKFYDARDGRAIKENESNMIICSGCANNRKFGIMIKQISGAIARRIVCDVRKGDRLSRGQRYGMIKFGSRTEVYMPVCDYLQVAVKVGDKVNGGTSVIAKIR